MVGIASADVGAMGYFLMYIHPGFVSTGMDSHGSGAFGGLAAWADASSMVE